MKKTKSKKVKNDEIRMRWTVKDFFEFLKPSWWSVGLTVLVFLIYLWLYSLIAPMVSCNVPFFWIGGELTEKEIRLCNTLNLSFNLAVLIIAYTLISLITYLVSGRWKE